MTYLNELSALYTLVLQLLVTRGYWPQIRRNESVATAFLARGIILAGCVIAAQIIYHDLLRSLGVTSMPVMPIRAQLFNAVTNTGWAIAFYFGLKALECSVDADERQDWPWYKAPFYPGGNRFVIRRKRD